MAATLLMLLAPAVAVSADGDAAAIPSEEGVLLLRNGQVLQGRIAHSGGLYCIAVPEGEIHLNAAEVEFPCRSVEEAYQRQCAAVAPGDVHGHLRLAQWCIRNKLLRQAEDELAVARAIDPKYPLVAATQRQLEMATEPARPPQQNESGAAVAPSSGELDRMVRGLPRGSVETFTQTIQPLLVNNCTASGCHTLSAASKLTLLRTPAGRPSSRRVTQRNLHAVLEWVDREQPQESPLLTVPQQPHGTAKAAIFDERRGGQFQRLADWVFEVSGRPKPAAAAAVADQSTPRKNPPAEETRGFDFAASATPRVPAGGKTSDRPHPARSGAEQAQAPRAGGAEPKEPLAEQHSAETRKVKRGAPGEPLAPADPFDPEQFNRRFFGPEGKR